MSRALYGTLSVVVLIGLWQLSASLFDSAFVLPSPTLALRSLSRIVNEMQTYRIIAMSLSRLAVAFSIAFFIGTASGVLAGESSRADALLQPLVIGLRTIPVASVIVIVLIVVGRSLAVYPITFLMLYPIFHEGAKRGIHAIDSDLLDASALERVSYPRKLFRLKLPLAAPYVKTASLQSLGLGFKVLVMAEFIAQVDTSIGRALYIASLRVEYADVFAWTIILIVIVFVIDALVNALGASSERGPGHVRKNLFKPQRNRRIFPEK